MLSTTWPSKRHQDRRDRDLRRWFLLGDRMSPGTTRKVVGGGYLPLKSSLGPSPQTPPTDEILDAYNDALLGKEPSLAEKQRLHQRAPA